MTMEQAIAEKLATLNAPDQVYARGGVRWGYDPQNMTWFTEQHGRPRHYENTTMGIPASVQRDGRKVSADGNVMDASGPSGGILHGNSRWSNERGEFYAPFSWDKLATYGTLAALTAGTANAALGGPAAGGAAAGLEPSLSAGVPSMPWTLSTAGNIGALTPPTAWLATAPPLGTTAADVVSGSGLPEGTSPGVPSGGVGSDLLARLRGKDGVTALASLLPLLAAATRGGTPGGAAAGQAAMPTGLEAMLNMSVERAKRTDPLHQSITQLAMSRLPTNMQR